MLKRVERTVEYDEVVISTRVEIVWQTEDGQEFYDKDTAKSWERQLVARTALEEWPQILSEANGGWRTEGEDHSWYLVKNNIEVDEFVKLLRELENWLGDETYPDGYPALVRSWNSDDYDHLIALERDTVIIMADLLGISLKVVL